MFLRGQFQAPTTRGGPRGWGGPRTPRRLVAWAPGLCPLHPQSAPEHLPCVPGRHAWGPCASSRWLALPVTLISHAVNSTKERALSLTLRSRGQQRARPLQGRPVPAPTPRASPAPTCPHGRPTCSSSCPEFTPLPQGGGEPRTPRVTPAARDGTETQGGVGIEDTELTAPLPNA